MKNEEFGTAAETGRIELSAFSANTLSQVVCFFLGAMSASASADGYFSPMGIAFCSGISREKTMFSCFGAMAGYILANDYIVAFRYIMALILVYVLKVYAFSFPSLQKRLFVPALISFFSTFSTGIISSITQGMGFPTVITMVAESIIAYGGAYFFAIGHSAVSKYKKAETVSSKEVTGLAVSVLSLVLTASRLSLLGVTPSGVACSYVIMVAAYLYKESGGAIIGTGTSLGFVLTGNGLHTVFCYAGAGLFSGLFSYSGRVLCACAYIFSYGAMYVFLGGDAKNIAPLIETAIASVFFVMTPQKLLFRIKMRLFAFSSSDNGREQYGMLVGRIKAVRNAVGDMSGIISRVSELLKEKSVPDTTAVCLRVRDNVCSDCASYSKCWKSSMSATLGEFDCVVEELRKRGTVTTSGTPMSLQSKCIRIMSLCDSFNKNYASYSARCSAEGRINEMRKITADQFDTVCQLLDELLQGFEKKTKPLGEKSTAVKNSLEDIGVRASVTCYEDDEVNTFVNITAKADCKVSDEEIRVCLEKVMEKDFPIPTTVTGEEEKMLLFWEKAKLNVECNFHQIPGKEGEICGDYFESFYDGKGNFIAVLSDGMGRGNRAAIDGTMAASLFSRLIISGFSFPCALRLVNSAMMVKSPDESLATLDILKVNLYNGHSVIYKAGAAPSILYRGKKVGEIKKSALPIGILRQTEFATIQGRLKDGDVIVLMSDGATDNNIKEIKDYIGQNGYSDELPEKLCAVARGRSVSNCDDITVATIKISEE